MYCQSPYVQFTLINVKVNYFNHKLGSAPDIVAPEKTQMKSKIEKMPK